MIEAMCLLCVLGLFYFLLILCLFMDTATKLVQVYIYIIHMKASFSLLRLYILDAGYGPCSRVQG
jgi:hypothetical protein